MIEPSNHNIPEEFLCPISCDFMEDPVRTATGHIYDRKNIEAWFKNHNTDPLSTVEIKDKTLTSLPEFKKKIEDYKKGEAIGFYHSGLSAIENKNDVPAKAYFITALETQKPGELSEVQIQLAQYYIHKLSGEYLKAMICLTKAALLKSSIAHFELQNTDDNNTLFLLSVCVALTLGFSGQSDIFFNRNSKWHNKCHTDIIGIFGSSSIYSSNGYIVDAHAYIDWVREKGAKTTLDFFYHCVSQKIITLGVYVNIINKLLENNKNVHFKDKAYYDLHKAILLLDPQKCNTFYLNNITPEFLFSQINDPDELLDLKNIFQSIPDEAMRTKLKNDFFGFCNIGGMMMTSNLGDKTNLSKSNKISLSEECWIHYKKGCESIKKRDYTPAKAHFMTAIELGFLHPEDQCEANYCLGVIHRHSKQNIEAMGYFTKAMLLNTQRSEKITKEFLDDSLMPDELLSICSAIIMVFSGRFFEDRDVKQLFNPHFNKYINSFTTRGYFCFDKSGRIPHEWIAMISCNLENLEKSLQFFNYCVSHKIIKTEIVETIIQRLNIPLDKFNQSGDVDTINENNYVLFKAFLSTDIQKAEVYLKKIPPLFLYSQLNNSSEISDLRKIPVSFKYIILDKFSTMTEAFQDPNYCKIVSEFIEMTSSEANPLPKNRLENHIRNLYMCNNNYDVLKLKESALKQLNEHPSQSITLPNSMIGSRIISDNEKMSCAINHIIILFDNCKYSGKLLEQAKFIQYYIEKSIQDHMMNAEDNFILINEFYDLMRDEKIKASYIDIKEAFHDSKRVLREVIKDVGCNINLPPIEIKDIENAISHMMLLLNILYRSRSPNPQKNDSLFATTMTFFENNFNPNPEIPLIQSCLKVTASIQTMINHTTLTTEELLPFLSNFKRYIEQFKKENKSIIKEDSLDVFNEMIKACDNIIKRLDQDVKKGAPTRNAPQ